MSWQNVIEELEEGDDFARLIEQFEIAVYERGRMQGRLEAEREHAAATGQPAPRLSLRTRAEALQRCRKAWIELRSFMKALVS